MLVTCTHKAVSLAVAAQIKHIDPDRFLIWWIHSHAALCTQNLAPPSSYFSECHSLIISRNHYILPALGPYVSTIIIRSTLDSALLLAHEPNGHQISYVHSLYLSQRYHPDRTSDLPLSTEMSPDRWSNVSSLIAYSAIDVKFVIDPIMTPDHGDFCFMQL